MGFALIIFVRILFGVCMVFIIGYIFGGFSKNPRLVSLTRIAAILVIVLFIVTNGILMRLAFAQHVGEGWPGWKCMEMKNPK